MIRTHYIKDLSQSMDGKEVTLAGWVHEVRELGNLTFLLLRDSTGIIQVIGKRGVVGESIIKDLSLPKESVIKVRGKVKVNKEAKAGFELIPEEVENLNPLSTSIPFEVTGKVPVELDTRLNFRYIDMRRLNTSAIFSIESTVLRAFTEGMYDRGFSQIRPPGIVAEATEGGAELFPVQYFEYKTYLAQSPQLYKQLAIIGGMDKVFMIVPAYRAEKSNDVYHLNESTQMDIEIVFADHNDAMALLSETVTDIIKAVKSKEKHALNQLNVDIEVPKIKTVTYEEAVDALKSEGKVQIEAGQDFTREAEIGIARLFGDAVIVRDYPTAIRAFYSMPNDENPNISNSYDFIYKGIEISSGAQRIHQPELLIEAIKKKGMDPKNFEFYINAFRCGAPPHAGWSIGLERIVMKITGSSNIRECSLFPRDRRRVSP